MKALGFIEVYGLVTAIEALDVALKASNVHVVCIKKVKGGIVTVIVEGDVGSVNASVTASECAASKIGVVLSTHVIPKMYDSLFSDLLYNKSLVNKDSSKEAVLEIFDNNKKEVEKIYKGVSNKELSKSSKTKKKNS